MVSFSGLFSFFVIGIISVCSFRAAAQSSQDKDFDKLYRKMDQAYEAYDYETILTEELTIVTAADNRMDTSAANLMSYLAEGFYYQGDLDKAIAYSVKELIIRQIALGDVFPDYEILIDNLATINMEAGNFQEAISLYEEAIPLIKTEYGEKSLDYISSNLKLVEIYGHTNQWEKADQLFSSLIKDIGKKHEMYPVVLSNQAGQLKNRGHYTEAAELYQTVLELMEASDGGVSMEYVATLNGLGELHRATGRFPEAEAVQTQALRILDLQGAQNSQEYSAVRNNLAVTYMALGRYQQAADIWEDLAELDREQFGEDHPIYSITLGNLASVYVAMGQYGNAEDYYDRAIRIVYNSLGEETSDYAILLKQKALLYREQKRYEEALELFSTTVDLQKAALGETHSEYAKALYNLAIMNMILEKVDEARPFLEASLEIRKSSLGIYHPDYARSLRKKAILDWKTQDYESTAQLYRETFDNYFSQIQSFFPALSEAEKAKFYNTQLKVAFEEFNSFAAVRSKHDPGLLDDIYNYQLATKALIMYATNKVKNSILSSGDSSLINKYNRWIDSKEELSQVYSLTVEELETQGINPELLAQRSNQLERELSLASDAFAKTYQKEKVTWQDVRAKLKPGEAAVEIIRFRRFKPDSAGFFDDEVYYGALIVTSETKDHPKLVLLIYGDQMENRYLSNYRNAIKFKVEEDYSFQRYWEPIARYMPGIKKIYLSPDGVYNQINIASFRNPYTNKYLVEELEVQMVSNTKDLLSFNQEPSSNDGKALLFGYPNYNKGLENYQPSQDSTEEGSIRGGSRGGMSRGLRGSLQRLTRDDQQIEMLPGTQREVQQIAELYSAHGIDFDSLLQNDAVEESLKASLNPRSIHIATHGFFIEDEPPVPGEEAVGYVENPMLRSGLILAGANRLVASVPIGPNEEDGVLTAYEAMNLNLDQTDVVVLSACETGLGEVQNGEGVYGLQRAFLVAGAKSIIMSLWSVDDDATQKLMNYFYEGWVTTGNKLQSFRQAQLKLKEDYPEPFYWGAFVMIGN